LIGAEGKKKRDRSIETKSEKDQNESVVEKTTLDRSSSSTRRHFLKHSGTTTNMSSASSALGALALSLAQIYRDQSNNDNDNAGNTQALGKLRRLVSFCPSLPSWPRQVASHIDAHGSIADTMSSTVDSTQSLRNRQRADTVPRMSSTSKNVNNDENSNDDDDENTTDRQRRGTVVAPTTAALANELALRNICPVCITLHFSPYFIDNSTIFFLR
jgi:hypothetical protein